MHATGVDTGRDGDSIEHSDQVAGVEKATWSECSMESPSRPVSTPVACTARPGTSAGSPPAPHPRPPPPDFPLADALAEAVRGEHGDRCDLDNPQTPQSTVSLVRDAGRARVKYLLLCDSGLILDRGGEQLQVLTDTRFEASVAEVRRSCSPGLSAFGTAPCKERIRQAAQAAPATHQPARRLLDRGGSPRSCVRSAHRHPPVGPGAPGRAAHRWRRRGGRTSRPVRLARSARPAYHRRPRGTDPPRAGSGERRPNRRVSAAVQAPR